MPIILDRPPPPSRLAKSERRTCCETVNDLALLADALPRVLADMHFGPRCGTIARGNIVWWRPEYIRASLHFRRDYAAGINRSLRDAKVLLMAAPPRIICVCTREGEWRSCDGANRGRNLIDLGVWRWDVPYAQSCERIAALIGLPHVPTIATGRTPGRTGGDSYAR